MNPKYKVFIQSVNSTDPSASVNVVANIPESFMYDTAANYEAPFSAGLLGERGGLTSQVVKAVSGSQGLIQAMTAQVWVGSNQSEMSLELEFHAHSDPYAEVFSPIMQLMRLVTPIESDGIGVLRSPGPNLDGVLGEIASSALSMGFGGGDDSLEFGEESVEMTDPSTTYSANDSQQLSVNSVLSGVGNTMNVDNYRHKISNQISIQVGGFAFFPSVVVTHVQKTYQSAVDAASGLPFYAKVSIRFKPLFMVIDKDLPKMFPTQNASTNASPNEEIFSSPITFPVAPNSVPEPRPLDMNPEVETFPVE